MWVGAFSAAQTKLPSYVTPVYPALATGLAYFLVHGAVRFDLQTWMRTAFGVLSFVGAVLILILPFVSQHFLPHEPWIGLIGIVPLVAGVLAWWYWSCGQQRHQLRILIAGATAFATLLFGWAAARVDRHQESHKLLAATASDGNHSVPLAAYGILEPSWVFYAKRPIREIVRDDHQSLNDFLSSDDGYLITGSRDAAELQRQYGNELSKVAEVPYFLRSGNLILFTRNRNLASSETRVHR